MKKILVIDDDEILIKIVDSALKKEGYSVSGFLSAAEGLKAARVDHPDLIIMDVMIPGMDGPEAVRVIKADPLLKGIPVVFLTGLLAAEGSAVSDQLRVGDTLYMAISKPVDIEDLISCVNGLLR